MAEPEDGGARRAPDREDGAAGGTVTLAHGGGGKAMRTLVDDVFLAAFGGPRIAEAEDQARLPIPAGPGRLAFTTDGYVVDPLFFPGGDVGALAVNGTVNDLAVGGARPLWLSCAVVVEEGVEIGLLRRIAASMRRAADAAGVSIVTGDTKVVGRGAADKVFVTTAGVGFVPQGRDLAARNVRPGDVAIASGYLGDHGAAILAARGDLALEAPVESDTAPLAGLMEALLAAAPDARAARDTTRGGLAAALNEIALAAGCGIEIAEEALPLRPAVRGLCEILGLDPLYLANEGALVAFVPEARAAQALAAMTARGEGRAARIVGRAVADHPGTVVMNTLFGGRRIVDMLVGEQLPRIC